MTYVEKIIDITTGKEIIRLFTADEIAEVENNKAAAQNEADAQTAEQAAKNAARQAVLDKLGLSADEVAALLG